jgi:hypothetical protein
VRATLGVWTLALASMSLASVARADIAPPDVDACALLPAGSPCTTAGRARGECVATGDAGRGVCRLVARADLVAQPPTPAPRSVKPTRAPAKRRAPRSSSTSACSATAVSTGTGPWAAVLIVLLVRRRTVERWFGARPRP